ncbi:MAG: EamA family transporter [Rhodobacterales bacterium]|nr:MAG: EamA family transporter [Rhodobacterales bacterium]
MTQTPHTKNAAYIGAAYMVGAGLFFAVINVANTQLTWVYGLKSTTVAFWEYFIALLFSLPWVLRHLRSSLTTARMPLHILRVALAAGGVQLWVMGFATGVPIWQMIALIMTSPFFVTIGSLLLLGESVSRQRWTSLVIGFVGTMIILNPLSDAFSIALLYPLGASFLWAMYSLLTKHMTQSENPDTLTLYLLLLLTPINAALAYSGGFAIQTDPTVINPLIAIGIVVGVGILVAAAQYFLVKAYNVADAAYLQPFDYVKQPVNIFLGWLVYSYLPEGIMWLGACLIFAASLYLLQSEAKK